MNDLFLLTGVQGCGVEGRGGQEVSRVSWGQNKIDPVCHARDLGPSRAGGIRRRR